MKGNDEKHVRIYKPKPLKGGKKRRVGKCRNKTENIKMVLKKTGRRMWTGNRSGVGSQI